MKKIFRSLLAIAIAATTFTACEDVPAPYDLPDSGSGNKEPDITAEAKGSGTLEDPFNAVAAINEAKKLASGAVSDNAYYIKGIVVSIATDKNGNVLNFDQGSFGNATFYISDDGTTTNQFYCYRVLYLGNKKWTQGAGDVLKVGDEVIVCAKLTMYNTTPETQQNEGYLYSLNGKSEGGGSGGTGVATGDGTLDNPFNSVAATNEAKKLSSGDVSDKAYYIKGKVVSIATDKNGNVLNYDQGTFGNATFYISDDGTTTNQFYCYRVLYLGNKKWTQGAGDVLKVGDEVIVCAKLTMYNTTPETQQNEGYLYSLNGKTEGSGGGDTPTPPSGDTKGTADSPYTVTDALAASSGTGVYIKAFIVGTVTDKSISTAEFSTNSASQTNLLIAASADETNIDKCMPVQLPAGDIRTKLNLKDNPDNYKKEVTIYGNIEKYFSVTGVKSVTYAILDGTDIGKKPEGGNASGGNDTPGAEAKAVTVEEFKAAAESTDVWYQLTGTISNLKDNDQYGNFDLTDSTGSVYVYGVLSEKGGAKKLFQTLAAEKGIKNGSTITIIGNRGSYNGKIEVTNAYFVSISN